MSTIVQRDDYEIPGFNKWIVTGSPSKDKWKRLHKDYLPRNCWASDIDLVWVAKVPFPFVVCAFDFKKCGEGVAITFAEAIVYRCFIRLPGHNRIPVYLVRTDDFNFQNSDPSSHRFSVYRLDDIDHQPQPPHIETTLVLLGATWQEFALWGNTLRKDRTTEMVEYMNTVYPGE